MDRARISPFAYVLTICIGVIGSNSLALGPIAPEVARSLGADVPGVMTASAAFGLGTAVSAVFLGRFIDRYGPRRMLAAALLLLATGLGGSALAPSLAFLVAAQLVVGLAAGIALPSIYTLASVIAPAGRESETIGLVLTGWTLSMVAGVPLSAAIADLAGWRMVYVIVAVATMIACAVVKFAAVQEGATGRVTSPLAALNVRGVAPLLVACAAFMAAFYGVYAYIGEHLHAALGLPVTANGLIAVSYGFGFGAAAFLDRLIDRFGAGRLLPLIFLAVGAFMLRWPWRAVPMPACWPSSSFGACQSFRIERAHHAAHEARSSQARRDHGAEQRGHLSRPLCRHDRLRCHLCPGSFLRAAFGRRLLDAVGRFRRRHRFLHRGGVILGRFSGFRRGGGSTKAPG